MEITVIRRGLQTTVQDLGRRGHRAEGVAWGGAMDSFALRVANMLVGNPEDAAALECALIGPELEFSHAALVAVTGAAFENVPAWRTIEVAAGTRLRLGPAVSGARGYLAMSGGVNVERVLGSCSTDLRGGWGGFFGRAVQEGDRLTIGQVAEIGSVHPGDRWRIDRRILPNYVADPTLRVVRGSHLQPDAKFFGEAFQVTAKSDRMGFRLEGRAVVQSSMPDLLSSAVLPGTLQLPPDGQPVLLMADAQTIGGYPQIGHVIEVDLPLAAQLRPGATVRFNEVAIEEAHHLTRGRERSLALLRQGLADKLAKR